ncbi:Yippee domain-containing protein [Rhizoctonia solani AG-1 IA]|uniref:Protein yippee-like n=1 Tax=Thanatephorus cucumeris (strain AG1-IA) TaxID=983506 RepID=L8X3Y1_THACA|nr:Yippee domain-containing protein [Rhizoctonia solani AG-1 IA]
MGMTHREYLSSQRIYGCKKCRTHLAIVENMLSRVLFQAFNGQHGRAYLFEKVVNIKIGPPGDRPMTTGLHTVRDIYCVRCGETLGWKYRGNSSSSASCSKTYNEHHLPPFDHTHHPPLLHQIPSRHLSSSWLQQPFTHLFTDIICSRTSSASTRLPAR